MGVEERLGKVNALAIAAGVLSVGYVLLKVPSCAETDDQRVRDESTPAGIVEMGQQTMQPDSDFRPAFNIGPEIRSVSDDQYVRPCMVPERGRDRRFYF
jgi:hypothetical protein